MQTAVSWRAGVDCSDVPLHEGDTIQFGSNTLLVLETPGHTDSCLSFYLQGQPGYVFTGDALLIRGCGRTDFQQGSSETLFRSVRERLFSLPGETQVFPAHDYRGHTHSTIAAERAHNPRLGDGRTLDEFIKAMNQLKLAQPKKIHEALPANMSCGKRGATMFQARTENGIPEITPEDLSEAMKRGDWSKRKVRLIDVRRPDEFNAELGHVKGAVLVTLGPDLQSFVDAGNRDEEIVFICRSGGRSGQATDYAKNQGYSRAFNMRGGMLRWNELKFPIEQT